MKARTPAASAATSAKTHSTTRIERSSRAVSWVESVVWRNIDVAPVWVSPRAEATPRPIRRVDASLAPPPKGADRPVADGTAGGQHSYHARCTCTVQL